jgi:hypothetical protein
MTSNGLAGAMVEKDAVAAKDAGGADGAISVSKVCNVVLILVRLLFSRD